MDASLLAGAIASGVIILPTTAGAIKHHRQPVARIAANQSAKSRCLLHAYAPGQVDTQRWLARADGRASHSRGVAATTLMWKWSA
jgi:hypothetical protein